MKVRNLIDFPLFIFGSVWTLFFIQGRDQWFRDPGSFFHTIIGERILVTGHLIYHDQWSFTRVGEDWIASQWLGEITMALFHRIAGLDGLFIMTISLLALLYSVLGARIERSGVSLFLGSFVLFLSLTLGSQHFHARPHISTLLFMPFLYAWAIDIDSGKKSIRSLVWLIPIFVIWANTHGGVLGGLFTLFLIVSGWTVAFGLRWKSPIATRRRLVGTWALVLLCLATPCINPYGTDLPSTWMKIMGSQAVSEYIDEHASLWSLLKQGDIAGCSTALFLLYLGSFYLALLAGTDKRERKITWYIPLVWFVLSLSRIRHAPIYAVLVVLAIAEIYPCCRWLRTLEERGLTLFHVREIPPGSRGGSLMRYFLAAAVTTAVALSIVHGSAQLSSTSQKWIRLDGTHWPVALLPELQALERSHPNGISMFNDMLFGGFLVYHVPGLRVFIDDRCELYGDEFLTKYVKAERSDFEIWAETYRFDHALVRPNSKYRKYLEEIPGWHVVKDSPAAILYAKRAGLTTGTAP